MGLFGKKEECCICHIGKGKYESQDGMVCQECFTRCGRFLPVVGFSLLKTFHKEEIESYINQNEDALNREKIFNPTLQIENFAAFDKVNHLWRVNENGSGNMKLKSIVWEYDNFDDLEIVEDEKDIIQGSLGSALVGGALFGGVGAIVGSAVGKKTLKKEVKKLEIRIKLKKSSIPEAKITLIQSPVQSDSTTYKKIYDITNQIIVQFTEIKNLNETPIENNATVSPADEILKYKNLLDAGAITQEEYEAKKKQLLGL